eukprot:11172861-Lingulodinium_polyedra.AAC.1
MASSGTTSLKDSEAVSEIRQRAAAPAATGPAERFEYPRSLASASPSARSEATWSGVRSSNP